ncbi:DUF4426 domain-containing protein [Alteromonas sp. LMIT006]|jgi:hypothetical protein|uniref:DUF4426 domain-containing protein n=1 Tax=Alteromonadaceae TaxID=72275 RepID=UPI0020CA5ED0|nr:DUF4426 domain-containing protein [Alteromonas sp. LMIT006]UTP73691.1 DUF4426 domain-containing protein [Alteromonas sp. LMIT006]
MRKLFSFLLIGLFCLSAHAEIKQTLGPWDVHYIVFPSTFLTPEIAKANGLVRSKFNAVVNISVLDKDTKEAQMPDVEGTARNLIGTSKELKFKRVVDGDAVYYLAPLAYRDRETYRFKVTINDRGQTEVLEFQQQMYVD